MARSIDFGVKKKACVPACVTAGQPSVAVRCPSGSLFRSVIELMGEPLVAPSANRFQQVSPTSAQHVAQGMGDVVAYILDGGPCSFGLESTILSLVSEDHPTLLRQGPITQESLEAFLERPIPTLALTPVNGAHLSPGLYKRHYSPKTPLYLVHNLEQFQVPIELKSTFEVGAAHVFLRSPCRPLSSNEFVLSPKGDLLEVAASLFDCLQRLDNQQWQSIWMEKAPDAGVGKAINDRLSRAAVRDLSEL